MPRVAQETPLDWILSAPPTRFICGPSPHMPSAQHHDGTTTALILTMCARLCALVDVCSSSLAKDRMLPCSGSGCRSSYHLNCLDPAPDWASAGGGPSKCGPSKAAAISGESPQCSAVQCLRKLESSVASPWPVQLQRAPMTAFDHAPSQRWPRKVNGFARSAQAAVRRLPANDREHCSEPLSAGGKIW